MHSDLFPRRWIGSVALVAATFLSAGCKEAPPERVAIPPDDVQRDPNVPSDLGFRNLLLGQWVDSSAGRLFLGIEKMGVLRVVRLDPPDAAGRMKAVLDLEYAEGGAKIPLLLEIEFEIAELHYAGEGDGKYIGNINYRLLSVKSLPADAT